MVQIFPHIESIASALPRPHWSTEALVEAAGDKVSKPFVEMVRKLGVDNRHSILANYPDVIFGRAEPKLALSATTLAVQAVRACFEKSQLSYDQVGLVLGVSSSPARLLPSLVGDLIAQVRELPRSVDNLSIEYMGCSAIARVIEVARWYLTVNPGKAVLAVFMDAITPLSPPIEGSTWRHFSEIPASERQQTVNGMHGFLFGDASVAMLLTSEGDGPSFSPIVSLTNDLLEDTELGTVPDGGSDDPVVHGRRLYTLSPLVASRGAHYAKHTVGGLLASGQTRLRQASDANFLMIHTGSNVILDRLCEAFGVAVDDPKVASSYRVLREFGNTIGCSVPMMLAEPTYREPGEGIVMAFGLTFAAGAFAVRIPAGGWKP